jgi:hypothetical protein
MLELRPLQDMRTLPHVQTAKTGLKFDAEKYFHFSVDGFWKSDKSSCVTQGFTANSLCAGRSQEQPLIPVSQPAPSRKVTSLI